MHLPPIYKLQNLLQNNNGKLLVDELRKYSEEGRTYNQTNIIHTLAQCATYEPDEAVIQIFLIL